MMEETCQDCNAGLYAMLPILDSLREQIIERSVILWSE
jgi:hypothetical protein